MDKNTSWAAGLLSVMGSFSTAKVVRKQKYGQSLYIRYTVKSKRIPGAVKRFAEITGTTVRESNDGGVTATLAGDKLHEFILSIWDELPIERKREYKKMRDIVKASKL